MITPEQLENVLEAAIFAAAEPLSINQLMQMIFEEERPERDAVKQALQALMLRYEGRGVSLKEVASGFLFVTNPQTAPYMQRLLERTPPRYSRALLETLALIIYRQPITRGEIEQVRGVAVNTKIIQTLIDREWISVVGHKAVPGQPALYAPTKQLFDYFTIKNMEDLPPLDDLIDLDRVGEKLSKQLALDIPEQDNADEVERLVLQPEKNSDEIQSEHGNSDVNAMTGDDNQDTSHSNQYLVEMG
jgi:segregation and condensation protein B